MRAWLARRPENAEKNRRRASQWKTANPERARLNKRRRDLRARYGMTLESWQELFQQQGSQCAICRSPSPGKRTWHTDHCHATGKVRGVLCQRCNTALGQVRDDVDILRRAADYLEHHRR